MTFKLLELEDNYYDIYTSQYGTYVVWTDNNGIINIFKITVSGGKASLEKIVEFSAETTI